MQVTRIGGGSVAKAFQGPGSTSPGVQGIMEAVDDVALNTLRVMSEIGRAGHSTVKSFYARYRQSFEVGNPDDFLVSLCSSLGRDTAVEIDAIAQEITNFSRPVVPLCNFAAKFEGDRVTDLPQQVADILRAFHCKVIVSDGRASFVMGSLNPLAVTKAKTLIEETCRFQKIDCPFVFGMRLTATDSGLIKGKT